MDDGITVYLNQQVRGMSVTSDSSRVCGQCGKLSMGQTRLTLLLPRPSLVTSCPSVAVPSSFLSSSFAVNMRF